MIKNLFTPIKLGHYSLRNRMTLAPMTRNRAGDGNVPSELAATYYRQRASAGLLITEATQVSPQGVGYPNTPGIYSTEQVAGWRRVVDSVHQAGGRIFLQLWHVGRISHSLFQPDHALPVAPSAVPPKGEHYTPEGMKPFETPRALDLSEIPGLIEAYRTGAKNAQEAVFDGVEIHGANGYLPDQFLRDGTNQRTDAYGGSLENRAKFLLEVTQAAVDVWGPDRVGVRLSPSGTFNDMSDSNPEKTFGYVISELDNLEIAYVHLIEGSEADERHGGKIVPSALFRPLFQGALILNGGYNRERADAVIQKGTADMVSFGTLFLANPDLPKRFQMGADLNEPDPKTFYGGGEKGYTDYPPLTVT